MRRGRTREMVTRLWRMLELIQGKRRGMTARALIEALGASRATVYRDLQLLQEAGVPIFSDPVNGEVRWVLDREPLPALRPSTMQLAALLLARDLLGPLDGTSLVKELDRLIGTRAGISAPTPVRRAPRAARASSQMVETIDRALQHGRRLRLSYRAASTNKTSWRIVDPLGLRLADDQLYLVAWDLGRKAWRTFKLTRVLFAHDLDEPADAHPDYDEERLFANAVRIWSADPVEVSVRMHADVAWLLPEWPLHPAQRIEKEPNGDVILRARVAGLTEARRWVVSWGPHAEALQPIELRTQVAEELSAALRHYSDVGHALPVSPKLRARAIRVGEVARRPARSHGRRK